MSEVLTFVVSSEYAGTKAGKYLRTVCNLSARTLTLLKKTEGSMTADGALLRTIDILKEGSVIKIILPDEINTIVPIKGELNILYEDSYLLVVNKPGNMPVHPVKTHQEDTLANIIAYHYREKQSEFVFRAINRLDRNTSGLVIIAKDRHTASVLQKTDIKKKYLAICHGIPGDCGTINEPIGLKDDSKIVRTICESGQNAITHYKRLSSSGGFSLIELNLETGRTHQIRCHMSYIGHPLIGDDLYGGNNDILKRQALHCSNISFKHPFTNESVEINCELPEDMNNIVSKVFDQKL